MAKTISKKPSKKSKDAMHAGFISFVPDKRIPSRVMYLFSYTLSKPSARIALSALGVFFIGWLFYKPVFQFVTKPRPMRLTAAKPASNHIYAASNKDLSVFIGEEKTNKPSISMQTKFADLISFSLTETNKDLKAPVKKGNTVTFADVRNQVDLVYSTLPNGIKEEIIIKSPQEGNAFTFDVNAVGATPKMAMTTAFYTPVFYDANGNYLYHIQKPFAVDKAGNRTDNVLLQLQKGDGGVPYKATVVVDETWLQAPERVYPITIDPTIVHDTTAEFATGTMNRVADVGTGFITGATGGTITYSGGYTIHTFTSSGTFTPSVAGNVEVLVVGGGGGGGSDGGRGGGGGGGGYQHNSAFAVTAQAYSVTIGAGGAAGVMNTTNSANGGNSSFSTITATGGGRGGGRNGTIGGADAGGNGGSGGGGDSYYAGAGGSGTAGQGYNGGTGTSITYGAGGGGGSGAVGANGSGNDGGAGGAGIANSISGSSVTYGCGGGGGYTGTGGAAGCSNAGAGSQGTGANGTANTGGGGGGGGGSAGGSGGSGIVIIRYPTIPNLGTTYQELPADQNTVGLWHMNEASGNVTDSSGNGNTGTPNGTTVTSGLIGNSRNFVSNSNDAITFTSTNVGTNYTIETWVNFPIPLNTNWRTLFANNGGTYHYMIVQNNANNLGVYNNGFYACGWDPTSVSGWHHLAIVVSSGVTYTQFYLDGNPLCQSATQIINQNFGVIGNCSTGCGQGVGAALDEVRFSRVARTPEEIKLAAQRRPYSVYTSDVIDLTAVSGWTSLTWTELGVATGDGETLKDATSLVAQWNFNETSGTTATNNAGSCGASCNGTLTNFASTASQDQAAGTGWTANNKRWGVGALMFDGGNDYVSIANNTISGVTNQISVAAWFKENNYPGSSNYQGIIGKANAWTTDMSFLLDLTKDSGLNNAVRFTMSTTGSNTVSVNQQNVTFGEWHYVVGTYDGSTVKLYLDGKQVGTTASISGNVYQSSVATIMGGIYTGDNGGSEFNGIIDSTQIYSRALTAAEILSNYNSSNVEFQTRVGADTSPDDGSWEAWRPVTGETAIESYDGPYQYNTTDTGLVSYWPMDETADNTCTGGVNDTCDKKGTNDGAATGTKIVDGKYGKARNFNGSSDKIVSSNNVGITGAASRSVEFWLYPTRTSGEAFWGWGAGTTNNFFEAGNWYNNNWSLHYYNGNWDTGVAVSPYLNKWSHHVVTFDGTYSRWYINGALIATSGSVSLNTGNGTFHIGNASHNDGYFFQGGIDEVRVYSSALSAATIQQHYLEGTTRPETLHPMTDSTYKLEGSASQKIETGRAALDGSTVGLWHLDETGGTGAYLKDSTANANHGTPTGTSVVNGISGKARSYTGTDIITHPLTGVTPTAGTVEMWVKPNWNWNDSATHGLWQNNNTSNVDQDKWVSLFKYSSNNLYFRISIAGVGNQDCAPSASGFFTAGQWTHVAAAYSSSGMFLYINGALVCSTGAITVPTAALDTNGRIGYAYASPFGSGVIDEVRISNTARSAEEIAESYRAGQDHYINKTISSTDLSGKTSLPFYVAADRPGTYLQATVGESAFANYQPDNNTVGFWHLDELAGSGAYLKDASGSNNHATPTSGTAAIQGQIGKGRKFNGSSDYLTIPDNANLNFGSSNFAIDLWIYPTLVNGTWQDIFTKGDASGYHKWVDLWIDNTNKFSASFRDASTCGGNNNQSLGTLTSETITANNWYNISLTRSGNTFSMYVNGRLVSTFSSAGSVCSGSLPIILGRQGNNSSYYFSGIIDEVRVSNTARSADDIRQAYEVGRRTHPITIDFGAKLDSGNLIANTSDVSFTVDATYYGLSSKGSNVYKGDKIIVRENVDGTEYIAQGTVTAVTASTGAVTVAAWDSGSTVPSGGFTVNASVFKWQREYWNIYNEALDSHIDAVTNLTLRLTDGAEGRTIWLDDLRSNSAYLTDPAGSTITSSTGNQYFQYRVFLHSWDEAVSATINSATIDYTSLNPLAPTIGTPTNVTTTAVRWAFTDNASNEDGFRLYDESNTLKSTASTTNLSFIDESGLTPATQYTRKVTAYNGYGNSAYSATASVYTLAATPPLPVVTNRQATTVQVSPDPGTNPAAALMALYKEEGTTCDGSGGNYIAADGSSNGATALWQNDATWGTVTVSGLSSEKQYAFCVKAKNGDNVETAFSSMGTQNSGYVPLAGNYIVTGNTSFINKYVDGSDASRYVAGVDAGTGTTNTASLTVQSGILTVNANETIVAGSFDVTSTGSIAIATGGQLKPGSPLWSVDADLDGYTSNTKLWYGAQPTNGRRKNLLSTLSTSDCNDGSYNTSNVCCTDNGGACSASGDCCSSICGTDADSDNYFSSALGQTGTCQATSKPYTDCYDSNANAKPGQTTCYTSNRGDGSYDYNCDSSYTLCTSLSKGNTLYMDHYWNDDVKGCKGPQTRDYRAWQDTCGASSVTCTSTATLCSGYCGTNCANYCIGDYGNTTQDCR